MRNDNEAIATALSNSPHFDKLDRLFDQLSKVAASASPQQFAEQWNEYMETLIKLLEDQGHEIVWFS